jgi:hypothetical protein
MIRETGLEDGNAIYYERSDFKASSGEHSKFTLVPSAILLPSATHTSFLSFFFPEYSDSIPGRHLHDLAVHPDDLPVLETRGVEIGTTPADPVVLAELFVVGGVHEGELAP